MMTPEERVSEFDLIREALEYTISKKAHESGLGALARLEAEHTGQGTAETGGDRLADAAVAATLMKNRGLSETEAVEEMLRLTRQVTPLRERFQMAAESAERVGENFERDLWLAADALAESNAALRAERDAAREERDKAIKDYMHGTQKWVDGTCHYRNLAIQYGAKPDEMLDRYDRELCENHKADDPDGWEHDAVETWQELEAAEAREAAAVERSRTLREALGHYANEDHWAEEIGDVYTTWGYDGGEELPWSVARAALDE